MTVETCERCGKPRSGEAAVCPHCGARRGSAAGTAATASSAGAGGIEGAAGAEGAAGSGGSRGAGAGTAGKLGEHKLSPEEIQALLLASQLDRPPQTEGALARMVLPHPGTEGVARLVEVALTVLCAPLVLIGALAIRRRARNKPFDLSDEAVQVLAMVVLGSLPLDLVLSLFGLGFVPRLIIGLGSVAGLIIRAVIRARASSRHRRQLDEVAR